MGYKLKKTTEVPLKLAGASIGMGTVGSALGSTALQGAGTTTAAFISPAVNINMGGYVVGELKNLRRKK